MSAVPDGCIYSIYVPFVCTFGVRMYVDINLLNMEIIVDTQILKKFRVEPILVAVEDGALRAFLGRFWLKSEILENSLRNRAEKIKF